MKKLIAATALGLVFTAGAFAETNANNTRKALDEMAGGDTAVIDILMDENGADRDEADFKARWDAATPEQQAMLKDACDKGQEAKLDFSDMVTSHCKTASGN